MNDGGLNRRQACAALGMAATATVTRSFAQDFPRQPLKMLVGFSAGGGADTVARLINPYLAKTLGQAVYVDNRPGVGGNLAAQLLAKAPPDGHTIMMGTIAALAINQHLYGARLGFDPEADLAPVTNVVDSCNVLIVGANSRFTSMQQIAQAGKTGQLTYGSSGPGTAGHLCGVLFNAATGANLLHVPYKSGGALMTAVLSNEIDVTFASGVTAVPQIAGGKVRALGVTTATRAAALPQVPTMEELGLRGFVSNNWHGIVAPAKTPPAVLAKLNRAICDVLRLPEVVLKLQAMAFEPSPMTPEEFQAFMRAERVKWGKIVKDSGATA